MSDNTEQEKGKTYTPEEIAAQRAKMASFYDDNIPLLEKQLKYETLLTDIDEVRLRRVMVTQKTVELMTPPTDAGEEQSSPTNANNKRHLRTE